MDSHLFQTDRKFREDLNIRNYESLARRFQEPPTGPAWALVAPRRYGKTWALAGIKEQLGRDATIVALQLADRSVSREAGVLLIDEPGSDISWLQKRLADWKKSGKSTVVAMSPGEWARFCGLDSPFRLHRNDLFEIEALTPAELGKLTSRAPWAAETALLLPPRLEAKRLPG